MAQLTLTEKAVLGADSTMQNRLLQALFSKANYWLGELVNNNLARQKRIDYAKYFVKGAAGGIDIKVLTGFWLANFNVQHNATATINSVPNTPIGFDQATLQPYDNGILDTAGLDIVYDTLANVLTGDSGLPSI